MLEAFALLAILSRIILPLRVMQNRTQSLSDTPRHVGPLVDYDARNRLAPSRSLHARLFLVHDQALIVNDVPNARQEVTRLRCGVSVAAEVRSSA